MTPSTHQWKRFGEKIMVAHLEEPTTSTQHSAGSKIWREACFTSLFNPSTNRGRVTYQSMHIATPTPNAEPWRSAPSAGGLRQALYPHKAEFLPRSEYGHDDSNRVSLPNMSSHTRFGRIYTPWLSSFVHSCAEHFSQTFTAQDHLICLIINTDCATKHVIDGTPNGPNTFKV